jgi:hypothetical protein
VKRVIVEVGHGNKTLTIVQTAKIEETKMSFRDPEILAIPSGATPTYARS